MAAQASRVVRHCFSVTDSHCHVKMAASLQGGTPVDDVSTPPPFMCHIARAVMCGTHPDVDWDLIEAAATAARSSRVRISPALSAATEPAAAHVVVIPGFGVHPWFVPHDSGSTAPPSKNDAVAGSGGSEAGNDADVRCLEGGKQRERSSEELLCLLEAALQRHPQAIVGEIGLDKLRGPPEAVQLLLFVAQMKLAAKYGRPVSVHCVRSFGKMLQVLQDLPAEDTPPAIVLHGFTGSVDFARSAMMIRKRRSALTGGGCLVKKAEPLRIFFGVGAVTSLRVKDFAEKTLSFLLREKRMLLETDTHHTLLPPSPQVDGGGKAAQSSIGGSGGDGGTGPAKTTATHTTAAGCELVWDKGSCVQLAHLITRVSSCRGDDDDISIVEELLGKCEEAFLDAFCFSAPTSAEAKRET
ncbi:Cut9 interacting protein Scn1 [Trypanosoma rangeli]|uniref:Cut9 interacting protein Scn1 n=1 Tax=Trypanosoma rangeli TaxID=5698 RepID=A0A3S5IS07_TRYRA|nr:Cut9 interacting protein Scn1 [Trypanosoma rangeli]RNF09530.1 Cut9 interacting protein Scn1 [Trypanosoma rangeli]|eukprot:RNF09530.1 Cut9 interacting protein Scn1 [Trypanosoma rangeli]